MDRDMGLDMWFREDVMRILVSTHETMQASLRASSGGGEGRDAYERGFVDALRVVALAFGLSLLSGKVSSQRLRSADGERMTRLDIPREWRR